MWGRQVLRDYLGAALLIFMHLGMGWGGRWRDEGERERNVKGEGLDGCRQLRDKMKREKGRRGGEEGGT